MLPGSGQRNKMDIGRGTTIYYFGNDWELERTSIKGIQSGGGLFE